MLLDERAHQSVQGVSGKDCDAAEFVEALQEIEATPHIAQSTSHRYSAVPDEVAASEGCAISQTKRKLIEQGFGWAKRVGTTRQVTVRGLEKVAQMLVLNMTACNLVRMRTLEQVCLRAGATA